MNFTANLPFNEMKGGLPPLFHYVQIAKPLRILDGKPGLCPAMAGSGGGYRAPGFTLCHLKYRAGAYAMRI